MEYVITVVVVLGGHYTATVKVKSGDWYLFNDTNVSKTNFTGEK